MKKDEITALLNEYNSVHHFKRNNLELYQELRASKDWILYSSYFKRKHWDLESARKEALNHKHREEFRKKSRGAYNWAKRNNVYDEITSHMTLVKKGFTFEDFEIEVKNYKTALEFREKNPRLYKYASRKGWLKNIDLKKNYRQTFFKDNFISWNEDKVLKKMKKFKKRNSFKKKYPGAWQWARRNNKLEELYEKARLKNRNKSYTLSQVIDIIQEKQYQTFAQLAYKDQGLWSFIKSNKLQKKLKKYLVNLHSIFSIEEMNEALKRNKITEIQIINPALYMAIYKQRQIDESVLMNIELKDINYREKEFQKSFINHVKKISKKLDLEIEIKKEYCIPLDESYGLVDIVIDFKNYDLQIPVELKHDETQHRTADLKKQLDKYNKYFKGKNEVTDTYLVSPKGRYGVDQDWFIENVLVNLKNNSEIVLPEKIN